MSASTAVRTARTQAGLSQSMLARRAGVAQSTVSRIEHGELDPTWATMTSLLAAAGWAADPARTGAADLIAADTAARVMGASLRRGDVESAIRDLTEAVGRLLRFAQVIDGDIPGWVTSPPAEGHLDSAWLTYLATAFAYALETTDRPIPSWMRDAKRLPEETVFGDDPSPAFRAWLRARTPGTFLDKNILSRPEDWAIA